MKFKTTILLAFAIFSASILAQNGPIGHLTIFSEDGDKFQLILNGELINDVPQTNLRVEDLNQPYYSAKIKFADASLQDVSKNNLMIADVDGAFTDVTYKIKRDKNKAGKMKMNFFSQVPVVQGFIPPSNVHVIHYGQPRQVIVQNTGVVTQTQTTTIQNNNNINVGVNIGGVSMGVNINEPSGGVVTQTTTTTTSAGYHQDAVDQGCKGNSCMTNGNFSSALATLKKQPFDESKLKTAKQIIAANCLNVNQVIEIANLFSFEDNKLEFAKFAYDYCIEPRNYFKLNGIFSFSSNADALSDYVQSRN